MIILFFIFNFIGYWKQTDWSGGIGQTLWSDTTKFLESNKIDFSTIGKLKLLSPNIDSFEKVVELRKEQSVLCMIQGANDTIYIGVSGTPGYFYKLRDGGAAPIQVRVWGDIFGVPCIQKPFAGGNTYAGGANFTGAYVFRSAIDVGFTFAGLSGGQNIYALIATPETLIAGIGDDKAQTFISTDKGESFSLTYSFNDKKLLCLFKASDGTIYAGTGDNNGMIYKSLNNGISWDSTKKRPGCKSVYSITEFNNAIYIAGDNVVIKTVDGGLSWDTVFNHPLVRKANYIYSYGNYIYLGTKCTDNKGRIFFTQDGGKTWDEGGNIPNSKSVNNILITKGGNFYLGTDYNASLFRPQKYFKQGYIISSVFDTKGDNGSVRYLKAEWRGSNTQYISVKIRTSNDSTMTTATPWENCPPVINGQDRLDTLHSIRPGDRYVQYRVDFITHDLDTTPILESISIKYYIDWEPPIIENAIASGDEDINDSVIFKDYVIIKFNEKTDKVKITSSNIDSILRLSNNHTWLDGSGNIKKAEWDTDGQILTIFLSDSLGAPSISPGDTIFSNKIKDIWGNLCSTFCIIRGSFGPVVDSIVAYDGVDSIEYIDNDDYVKFYFSKRTNKPKIDKDNINKVFRVIGKNWLDGFGALGADSCIWDTLGVILTCFLKSDSLRPTIKVGDTVFPDSITIWDKFMRGVVVSPCVISGDFGDYGPVMDSAIAYEGGGSEPGVGGGDYVLIFFNELIDTIKWESIDIDSVLILSNNHRWHNKNLDYAVQSLEKQNIDGYPYTLLFIYFYSVGVEEKIKKYSPELYQNYPNPFVSSTCIKYIIPGEENNIFRLHHIKSDSLISIGDTIRPNPRIIKDFKGHSATKYTILKGSFDPSPMVMINTHNNKKYKTRLQIYNIVGQPIRTLVDEYQKPGVYTVIWDGLDDRGNKVKSGIYFYKLKINDRIFIKKMTMIK